MNKLVSIIVPVFNVEKYIEKCLKSLIDQTYKNIEVIIIDDGSTDSSGIICDKYSKNDKRIKVIHKKNEGVSTARNEGMKQAKGDYIFFIDSDDYLDFDVIDKMVEELENADIIKISHKLIKDNKEIRRILNVGIFSKEEYIEKVLTGNIGGHSWGYLLSRDIVNEVYFDKNTSCMEDTLFIVNCILKVDKIKCIDTSFYNHIINENGITASANRIEKNINDYMYSLNEIEKILKKININNYYKKDILEKRFKLIESELAKCSNKKDIVKIFNNDTLNKNLINIYESSEIGILKKIYTKIILKKRYGIFKLYNTIRKKLKELKMGVK